MGAYEMLAGCYDRLTSDVDYRAVAGFYRTLLDREGVHPRSAVDLACGTGSISAILAEQGLAVTGVDMSEEMLTQAAATGHQIALHSASHEYSDIYQSPDAYWEDIALLQERISPYILTDGIHYLRFPGGSTNTVSRRYGGKGIMSELKAQAEEKGYTYVDWNVCAEDAVGGKPSANTIYRNVVRETGEQTQCIVLMHDSATTRTTAEALPDIIQWYKDQGFAFCTVEQVLKP